MPREGWGSQVNPRCAPDGGAWIVVHDFTDRPMQAEEGHCWIVQPNGDRAGQAVQVPAKGRYPGVIALDDYIESSSVYTWADIWGWQLSFEKMPTSRPDTLDHLTEDMRQGGNDADTS